MCVHCLMFIFAYNVSNIKYWTVFFFYCGFVRQFVNTHMALCLQPNSTGHSQDIWSMWRSRVNCLTLLCLRSQSYENSALSYESAYIFSLCAWVLEPSDLMYEISERKILFLLYIIYTLVFFHLLILCKQLISEYLNHQSLLAC